MFNRKVFFTIATVLSILLSFLVDFMFVAEIIPTLLFTMLVNIILGVATAVGAMILLALIFSCFRICFAKGSYYSVKIKHIAMFSCVTIALSIFMIIIPPEINLLGFITVFSFVLFFLLMVSNIIFTIRIMCD